MADDEVLRFIHLELKKDPSAKCTRLLRRLRDSGRACEQARFKGLFQEVTA